MNARRALTAGLLVLALSAFVFAFTLGEKSTDVALTNDAVEQLIPERGDQVLRQTEIGIDLQPGWTAVLQVNGVEIPEDQLRRVDAQNQVFFTAGAEKEFEELAPGTVEVTALIWRPVDGENRADADAVRWSFQVS